MSWLKPPSIGCRDETVAVEAAEHAKAAEAVAELVLADDEMPLELVGEAVVEAQESIEIADVAAAEAYVAHEVADEAVVEAVVAEAVAVEIVEEADEAREVADEAAADAFVAETRAEDAVEVASHAGAVADAEVVEADEAAGVAAEVISASIDAGELAAAPAAEAEPKRDLGPEPTTMEELLNEQSGDIRSFKHGDVVEGTVVRIDKDEILVDIGAKSEGVVSNRELYGRNAESQPRSRSATPSGLRAAAQMEQGPCGPRCAEPVWAVALDAEQFDAGVIIEAPVIDHNKGGLIVDCGIRGFVPISQIVDFPRRPQNDQPRDMAQEIAEKLQPSSGADAAQIRSQPQGQPPHPVGEGRPLRRRRERDGLFNSLRSARR
jgi:hypothetical protein